MKKICLAMLLVLALCVSLLGCGEKKDGADYLFEALKESETAMQSSLASEPITEPVRLTLSVGDVASICTMLGADLGGMELTDAALSITAAETAAAVDASATVGGIPLSLGAVTDGKAVAFVSEHLANAYGATLEELLAMAESALGVDLEEMLAQITESMNMDPSAAETLDTRYEELLEALVREHLPLAVETVEENVVVTGELTPANVAAITAALVSEMQKDEAMIDLVRKTGGETAVEELLATEIEAAEIEADLTASNFGGSLKLTANKKTSAFVALELRLVADGAPCTIDIQRSVDGCFGSFSGDDTALHFSFIFGEESCTLGLSFMESDEETFTLTLDVAEEIVLEVEAEGETFGLTMTHTETENEVTLQLTEVAVGAFSVDVSGYGICFTAQTGVEAPVMPTAYTSIVGFTDADWQSLALEFLMSSGLFAVVQ